MSAGATVVVTGIAPPSRSPRQTTACAVCQSRDVVVLRRSDDIACDLIAAHRGLDRAVHDTAVDVFTCRSCASVFRDPATLPSDLETRFREATFSPGALDRLRARRRADCERDASWLRAQGLRPGARVLEIGSYVGAFLDFAVAHGCRATGYDIGRQVSDYCRRRGLHVVTGPFAPGADAPRIYDAVFVLNCFEQLPDPKHVLRDVGRVLRPNGGLVIRTPNAAFVRLVHEGDRRALRPFADANAVLGAAFTRCFSVRALCALLSDAGYDVLAVRGHEFTSLVPDGHSRAWTWTRPVRRSAFALASAILHEPVDPWIDISAAPRPAAAASRADL